MFIESLETNDRESPGEARHGVSTLQAVDPGELEQVLGGFGSLSLSTTPDRAFNDGAFLTEALRRGTSGRPPSTGWVGRRPPLRRSDTNPGWCDDGFGIVPCR